MSSDISLRYMNRSHMQNMGWALRPLDAGFERAQIYHAERIQGEHRLPKDTQPEAVSCSLTSPFETRISLTSKKWDGCYDL